MTTRDSGSSSLSVRLQALMEQWRKAYDYSEETPLHRQHYYDGYNAGKRSCADDLAPLLARVEQEQKEELETHMDSRTQPDQQATAPTNEAVRTKPQWQGSWWCCDGDYPNHAPTCPQAQSPVAGRDVVAGAQPVDPRAGKHLEPCFGQCGIADLLARVEALEAENEQWRSWGVIEIAVRNPNVASYMDHWEKRAEAAEAKLAALERDISAFWQYVENAYDVEPRAFFEKEAPVNGFGSPLAQAAHHIWKRDPKVDALQREVAELKADLDKTTEAWAIAADDRDEANGLRQIAEREVARLTKELTAEREYHNQLRRDVGLDAPVTGERRHEI